MMQLHLYSYKPQDEAPNGAPALLLQPVDSHDLEELPTELEALTTRVARAFVLVPVPVGRWFDELAPWPAPPVFGKTPFGNGAPATLSFLLHRVLPAVVAADPLRAVSECGRIVETTIEVEKDGGASSLPEDGSVFGLSEYTASVYRVILGGYSLAGLFALWAGTQYAFSAVVGASPSVWYPNWIDYAASHPMLAHAVYLSLGDTEHRSRTPIMATVDDCIHRQLTIVQDQHLPAILEMNPGNHFKDNGLRMAKGFAWSLEV